MSIQRNRWTGPMSPFERLMQHITVTDGPLDTACWIADYVVAVAPNVWCALNAAGIDTVASCCGHGKNDGSIVLADGRELVIRQFAPHTTIEQLRAIKKSDDCDDDCVHAPMCRKWSA